MIKDLIRVDLINLETNAVSLEELFKIISEDLSRKGLVKETYLESLLEREANFPTGLVTQHLNIGMPHTDVEHIEEPFMYIVRNNSDLDNKQMGDNSAMKTRDFFFLGIKDPSKQVGLLSELMELFMDKAFVDQFKAKNGEEIYQLLKGTEE